MAKCKKCGRKGLLLKVDSNGMCADCSAFEAEQKRLLEVQEKQKKLQLELEEQRKRRLELEERVHKEMQQEIVEIKELNLRKSVQSENISPELQPLPNTSVFRYSDDMVTPSHYSDAYNAQMQHAEKYNIDYVQVVAHCCCSECAKYRFRVYCLSGKDNRFPKLPEYVKKYTSHCGLTIYPFVLDVSYLRLPEDRSISSIDELVRYSNRPFVDDRSEEEKERYMRIMEQLNQERLNEINRNQAKEEYEQILIVIPDIAPKSQSGYLRMKKSNSENFQKLKEKAISAGIEIKDLIS